MISSRHRNQILIAFLCAAAVIGGHAAIEFLPAFPQAKGQVQEQRPGPPGTYRVRVRLVPVDVIVTDREDRPVTDLTQEEFQIFENGRRQEIRHFSIQSLTAAVPEPELSTVTKLRAIPAVELTPQESRTFLILLGRGRHQTPFKSVDALIRFVRNSLLPQDRIAVFAYNRATDFTTNHEQVAQVLERYKKGNEKIESWLESRLGGLAAVYGSKEIPKSFQGEIDKIFDDPGGLASRQVPPGRITDAGTWAKDAQKVVSETNRDEEAAAISPFDRLEADMTTEMSFDEFASAAASTYQDMQNIYTCIEYLRYMEGEKHLLFFTADGLYFPRGRTTFDEGLSAVANDARVAIDTFQTGGVYMVSGVPRTKITPRGITRSVPNVARWVPERTFALQSMRSISQSTGGRASINEDIGKALARVNEITRVTYLLGYYPADNSWDGEYRKINVRVSRPGLRVSFRRGYYARDTIQPFDREEFLAYSRISAAASYVRDLEDILFKIDTMEFRPAGDAAQIRVDLQIDPSKIEFRTVDGRRTARLRIVCFYADSRGRFLGEDWKNMDLRLLDDTYRKFMDSGVPYTVWVPLSGPNQIIKVIVYDISGDKVGSRQVKMK